MKKLKILVLLVTFSLSAHAGMVNGLPTKIKTYENGNEINFESKVPNITFKVKKSDVYKAMDRNEGVNSSGRIEKNGVIKDIDRKLKMRLERVNDGLRIISINDKMFITEKELDKIKKKK